MRAARCWDLCVFNIIRKNTETPRAEEQKQQLRPSSEQNFTHKSLQETTNSLRSGSSSTHVSTLSRLLSCRWLTDRWSGLRVYIDPQHRKWPHAVRSEELPLLLLLESQLSCRYALVASTKSFIMDVSNYRLIVALCFIHRLAFLLSSKPGVKIWGLLAFSFSSEMWICWESQRDECFLLKTGRKMKTSLRIGEVWEYAGWLSKWKVPVDKAVGVHNEHSS